MIKILACMLDKAPISFQVLILESFPVVAPWNAVNIGQTAAITTLASSSTLRRSAKPFPIVALGTAACMSTPLAATVLSVLDKYIYIYI